MERLALLIACAALAAACSSAPGPQVATADEQHCAYEARIGTSIPSTKCVTRAARDENKHGAQEVADKIRRAPARPSPAVAGGN